MGKVLLFFWYFFVFGLIFVALVYLTSCFVVAICSNFENPEQSINISWKTFSKAAENESDCYEISKKAWFNICPELKGNLNCNAIFEIIRITYNPDTKLCYLEIPVGGLNE